MLLKKMNKWFAGLALLLLLSGALAVRTVHFRDWLYFKMDQSRDAALISNAIQNGPAYLPLLGPRAGATQLKHGFLRLGPIFYYFQYISGKIFHSTDPAVLAYPEVFFSLLAILTLYFLSRIFFSRLNSFVIASLYAFSFLIIQYSRFSWNPNSLQFFLLLTFLGLLKFSYEERFWPKIGWLAVFSCGLAISSQLHFFGLFVMIGISGLFLIINFEFWKKSFWKYFSQWETWKKIGIYLGIFLMIFLIFYTPVILSDIKKNGENTHNFFEALGSKAEKKPFLEKFTKNIGENLNYYCLLTTANCYKGSASQNSGSVLITLVILAFNLFTSYKLFRQSQGIQRGFVYLFWIWMAVFSILTLPLAFQLRPRFFILVFAIPFIGLGFTFKYLKLRLGKTGIILSFLLALGILFSNVYGLRAWFKEQRLSQIKAFNINRTLILKAKDGVTLGQLQRVTNWIYGRVKENNTLYYYIKPEHIRPIDYLLGQKNNPTLRSFSFSSINENPNAQFFAIVPGEDKELKAVTKKYKTVFSIEACQPFGQLLACEITFPNRIVSESFKFGKSKKDNDRIFWGDIFSKNKNNFSPEGFEE